MIATILLLFNVSRSIMRWTTLSTSLLLIPFAQAHGRITHITTANGAVYEGWDPEFAGALSPPPPLVAWSASNLGNIFVRPSQFNTTDIACHYNAVPGALHVNTSAGDTLKLQWNEWPNSHVGPVVSFLAACNGSCANADKRSLQWVKIDELGWLNSTGWDSIDLGGTWATNVLIANGFSWLVRIPEMLSEGNYVLRHEIIALHVADKLDGAQAYPQCVNLSVKKGTSKDAKKLPGGVLSTRLYGMNDPGVLVDVHKKIAGYVIPGQRMWNQATPVHQSNLRR